MLKPVSLGRLRWDSELPLASKVFVSCSRSLLKLVLVGMVCSLPYVVIISFGMACGKMARVQSAYSGLRLVRQKILEYGVPVICYLKIGCFRIWYIVKTLPCALLCTHEACNMGLGILEPSGCGDVPGIALAHRPISCGSNRLQ